MSQICRNALVYIAAFVVCMVATASQARAPTANGIYVVVNPYGKQDVKVLATTQPSCTSTDYNPFLCVSANGLTAANGVFLRLPWCEFQIGDDGFGSCHYIVEVPGGNNNCSSDCEVPNTDDLQSTCLSSYWTFDICANSQLGAVLRDINVVNQLRAKLSPSQPPLKLEVSLSAGWTTPRSVLNDTSAAYIDTNLPSPGQDPLTCAREPRSWEPTYSAAYERAIDALLNFIASTDHPLTNPPLLTALKVTGVNSDSSEYHVPAENTNITGPTDPGPGQGNDPWLSCPDDSTTGAAVWLSNYVASGGDSATFVQAYETAFGAIVGYDVAELEKYNFNSAVLSQAIKYADHQFGDIECGVDGTGDPVGSGSCYVANENNVGPLSDGNWRQYNFTKFVDDVFQPNSIAYNAAVAAYQSDGGTGNFPLVSADLSVVPTALQPTPPNAWQNDTCWLSNTNLADRAYLQLPLEDGTDEDFYFNGTGTIPNWQTAAQNPLLSAPQYSQVMQNGLSNGAQFIEIERMAAEDYDYFYYSNMQSVLTVLPSTLYRLLNSPPPPVCNYGGQHAKHAHRDRRH